MDYLELFKPITTFILDIDGVLTDGSVWLFENGLQARRMSIRDGYALQLAIRKGYRIMIVSGGSSAPSVERLNKLGIKDIHQSIRDKKTVIQNYITANNLKKEEVLFMGDDMPDLPGLLIVGLPACPADAVDEIKQACKYISSLPGGAGCVREIVEMVLKQNDHWNDDFGITSS